MASAKRQKQQKSKQFFNRELSWIEFNARVLGEALRSDNPLLERLKFLAIVSSNLDEFFMVRVAGVIRQVKTGSKGSCPSGITPTALLGKLTKRIHTLVDRQYDCLHSDILPALAKHGLRLLRTEHLSPSHHAFFQEQFETAVFPVLSPVRFVKGTPLPCSGNARMHVGFALQCDAPADGQPCEFGITQLPPNLDRVRTLPPDGSGAQWYGLLEDMVMLNAQRLFPGHTIMEAGVFRLTRDADLSVDEERDEGFVEAMESLLAQRQLSGPVRLEIQTGSPLLRAHLKDLFGLQESDIYDLKGPLDLKPFMGFAAAKEYDGLRNIPWKPQPSFFLAADENLWDVFKQRDVLLHHPYQAFDPVVDFIANAADDPQTLAIKMILYRTSGNSPIVKALVRAAESGKQVTVLVELKARFDEGRNIEWAQLLERAGAIVIYGIANLKVHAKIALIIRRESQGMQRYIHLGTGNYNDSTARLYVDMGLFSSREDLTMEGTLFFNALTGYSAVTPLVKLVMAPTGLKTRILQLIEREIQRTSKDSPGLIMAKINSLNDPDVIRALYRASNAGVTILLNVRGICTLVPGVPNQSETITVVSVIDRYLEHTRAIYARNGGSEDVFLSSADWMVRNLDKRVELMFPVEQSDIKLRIINALKLYFADNTHSHILEPDGSYRRKEPGGRRKKIAVQEALYQDACTRSEAAHQSSKSQLRVRRTPVKSL